ncbi:asparagine synthase (glutamine-hydrolyzing) [Bradyrhizobium erythrophlei]|uniref:asparagine synthase (glutamine-hydrolyzing) n=1 Tax=Bradyrhizobium erythrophlei TaxID=1437360 RepID=A0A1M7UHW7_9BRAD|nr:asparagine synthase (glutamine-hydrolyzing) [Bradyrhizobium erythrophlei]SHN82467.1 asparagine synthase (glutamine-hydrolysing) [Bradyrhizobium erythrophlei]
MCGIAGLFRPGGGEEGELSTIAKFMTDALTYRGPDAEGYWASASAGVAFGHRRLSILDLSQAGSQPMHSDCGRFTVTFNGEIYNHLDIRAELEAAGEAPNWRGHSDTETLLCAFRHWGAQAAFQRLVGMFALALWDAKERTLTLARDRFGEKPLFYGWCGRDLVFGSELKALGTHPAWSPALDRSSLTSLMRYAYVPAPATIWTGIRKLPSASCVTFAPGTAPGVMPEPKSYWSLRETVVAAQTKRIADEREAVAELQRLLSIAVKRQCLSDVPLGAFLSGGIDSSTIVALMQAQASQPVRTFTIGFREDAFDEAAEARKVAAHLGTSHTELYVDPQTARNVIPKLPTMYDEPFGDSSQIPTHLVSVLARQHVTVALSGDAGDELFGGYNRHVWGNSLSRRFGALPAPLRHMLGAVLRAISPEPTDTIARMMAPLLPQRFNIRRAGDQAAKLARIVGSTSFDDMYRELCSIDRDPAQTILHGEEGESWSADEMDKVNAALDPLDRMTLADSLSYLTDDILQKVDRAAMAVALETRVPFLDKDVVEFAARIPPDMKVRDGRGKWLIRQLLDQHVPAALVDRPKTGFGIPIDDWLRGPLKPWASDLLSPARLQTQGLFNVGRVTARVSEHMSGRRNHGSWLWNVLMVQAWHDQWCTN